MPGCRKSDNTKPRCKRGAKKSIGQKKKDLSKNLKHYRRSRKAQWKFQRGSVEEL